MAFNARKAARRLAKDIYDEGRLKTATMNLDQLEAAVASVDTAMGTVISTIPGAWQTKTIKKAIKDNLPEPFQTESTAQEKSLVLAIWGFEETGVL